MMLHLNRKLTVYCLLSEKSDELEFKNMLSDEDDIRDAIITINSGAGGTESQGLG